MRVMHWNCQGLKGNPLTIPFLKDIRKTTRPDVMFLTETKNGYKFVASLCKELGYKFNHILPSAGLSGGMAIFWSEDIKMKFLQPPSMNCTYIYISARGEPSFCLSYIYGPPDKTTRNKLWKKITWLADSGLYRSYPRLMLGDLNDIKKQ